MVDYYPTVVFAFAKEINNGDNESKELLNGPFHHDTLFQGIIMGAQGPPIFWNNKMKCVINKHKFKVCISCSWQCVLGPLPLVRHT